MISALRRRPQPSFRIRTLLLLWVLCVAVACPAAWQSLSASLRNAAFAPGAEYADYPDDGQRAATLSPTDWAWEALGLSGRQSALSTAAILPEHREGRTSPGFSGRGPGDAVAMALVDAPALPSPLYKLLPVAWDSGDPGLRAPGTRGFFSRPPPSLTA